ncbi:hypothetical protein C4572_02800 [Candidatus Parcubacteria bacterium]|nr:MAG: hypothetical protein C4572_02800 [Candidatus Parcubacteria bacterium]
MFSGKKILFLVLGLCLAGSLSLAIAAASNQDDIVYPVSELGSCADKEECMTYCDAEENMIACVAFAEKHNLMSSEEVKSAKKFAEIGTGPGGCTGHSSCEQYCNNVNHIDECVAFAEKHGFMPEEELKEAKQIQAALKKGAVMPGGCTSKEKCETFCSDMKNMKECIAFAEAAGFMSEKEMKESKMALKAIEKGIEPPKCRGEKECDIYCSKEENFEKCFAFAEAAGFISAEEAEMMRKTGGVGPGGCRGKQCETFCEDPKNQQVCFEFAKEHGLIPEGELRMMEENGKRREEDKKRIQESMSNVSPEVISCLEEKLGADFPEKARSGNIEMTGEMGQVIGECFQQMMRQPESFEDRPMEGFDRRGEFENHYDREMMHQNFEGVPDGYREQPAEEQVQEQEPQSFSEPENNVANLLRLLRPSKGMSDLITDMLEDR